MTLKNIAYFKRTEICVDLLSRYFLCMVLKQLLTEATVSFSLFMTLLINVK